MLEYQQTMVMIFQTFCMLPNTPGISKHPTAALVGTKMIVVWEEVTGFISMVKATTVELKGIATGPVDQVNPTVHRVNR